MVVLNLFKRDKLFAPSQQIKEYTVDKVIGQGRYGICYILSNGEKRFILKQLKKKMLKKTGAKANFEAEILASISHASIPRFIEKIESRDFYGYVLEYKEGKTFEDIIYGDGYVFSRKEIFSVALQLIEILKFLHGKNIVHRDIRVPNTIFDGQNIFLVDFGLARWINNERYRADVDFAYLGDFLLHLYYSSYQGETSKKRPWHEELELGHKEKAFLKRLLGIEERYKTISEVERDFLEVVQEQV